MMDRKGMRTRMFILDRIPYYTEKYGQFSTSDVVHYLQVNHRRHTLTDREAEAVLMLMPEVEHIAPRRWRYDPGHISEDEKGIIQVCIMASGAIPVCALQDKYGQEAVRLAERNGTISIDEYSGGAMIEGGWASLTELGMMRAASLWEAVA